MQHPNSSSHPIHSEQQRISFPITPKEIDNLFTKLDTNHDETLSLPEVVEMFKMARLPPPSRSQLNGFFKTIDTNHDGMIQKDEFHRYIMKRQRNLFKLFRDITKVQTSSCACDQLPSNASIPRDNFNCHSLKKFALYSGVSLSDRDVKGVMKQLDLNKDNVVTFSELCEALLLVPEVNTRAFIDSWFSTRYPPSLGAISGSVSPFETVHPTRMNPPFLLKFLVSSSSSSSVPEQSEGKPEEKNKGNSTELLLLEANDYDLYDFDETCKLIARELDWAIYHIASKTALGMLLHHLRHQALPKQRFPP